jgi:DHA2 family multidrug resistance protein
MGVNATAWAARAEARGFDMRWVALGVTTIGSFMTLLDGTIVNIALPSILGDFGANLDSGQLVLTGYMIAMAIIIPVSGFLGDRVGMKRLYVATLVGFTVSSALCGLAWNLPSLIAFRAIQGLAGGALQPLGMAIVFTMITPLERPRFMAILGLPMLLAPLLGPTVGGAIIEFTSWRLIFLINLPIGILNVMLARSFLKETTQKRESRLDLKGFLLASLAFPCLILALSEGARLGWTSPVVLGLLSVGTIAFAAFCVVELNHTDPMLKMRLFGNRIFALAMAMNGITQFSLFGVQYILPLYLQQAHGLSPLQTGLILFPTGITSFLALNVTGKLYNRLGPRPLALIGLTFLLISTASLSRIGPGTSLFLIAGVSSLRGVALGLSMMPVQTAAYNTVAQSEMSRATSLVNVMIRLFGSTTTGVLTTFLLFSLGQHGAEGAAITGGSAPLGALTAAFDDTFILMSCVTVVGMFLALFLRDPMLDQARAEGRLKNGAIVKVAPAGAD